MTALPIEATANQQMPQSQPVTSCLTENQAIPKHYTSKAHQSLKTRLPKTSYKIRFGFVWGDCALQAQLSPLQANQSFTFFALDIEFDLSLVR